MIYDLYPIDTEEIAKKSWVDFSTDAMFTAQMQKWGNLMSKVESPAYLYLWNWYPSINGSKEYRAFHAAEVPYIFGTTCSHRSTQYTVEPFPCSPLLARVAARSHTSPAV